MAWAVVIFGTIFNTFVSTVLAKVKTIALILHITAFVAILISFVYLAPHSTPQRVFATFANTGDWLISFLVGFIGVVFSSQE